MIPRPKNTDTMADVLKMQNDYLKEKEGGNFKPAAVAIQTKPSAPKQSVYAKRRNIRPLEEGDKKQRVSSVIGDVFERQHNEAMDTNDAEVPAIAIDDRGFPKPMPVDIRAYKGSQGNSIFSQMLKDKKKVVDEPMEADESEAEPQQDGVPNYQNPDYAQGASDDSSPHDSGPSSSGNNSNINDENMRILGGMSEEEILEEQAKLLNSMDPSLVAFVKSKRKSNEQKPTAPLAPPASAPVQSSSQDDYQSLDFLKSEESKNWLHFDVLELEKLEWTKDIQKKIAALEPGETFEARFDWKGFLLPFVDNEKSESVTDDRELYLHGSDPHRPGYSLQEFFRLARSNVLQQRVAALNAIAGIIDIYNQGYYDGILELPLSKMFFFVRLAMDQNTPVIVEASSRALCSLFYNSTDETLLDLTYETKLGLIQPALDNKKASVAANIHEETEADLESSLKNLTLGEGRKMFESKVDDLVDDSEMERESFNDFHLAEVNLVECLVRTDILQRITYILTVMKPNDLTISCCVKILIRLARTNRDLALLILNKDNLIEHCISKILPSIDGGHAEPHHIVLKLFRILSSYDRSFCLKLRNLGVLDVVKSYLLSRKDMSINMLKLQIESLRFLRLYFKLIPDETSFAELIPSMQYLLKWHFQYLDFQADHHFILRQHASALLYLLACGNTVVTLPIFPEDFKMCCSKWFAMATRGGVKEISQKNLLSSLLDVATPFVKFVPEFFYDFINEYLLKFLKSPNYSSMSQELCINSPLLNVGSDRCNVHKPLINLGSIVRKYKKAAPATILTKNYSIYFMDSLLMFIEAFDNESNCKNRDYHLMLCDVFFGEDIDNYVEKFSLYSNQSMSTNWFLKTEINFIYNLLFSKSMQFNPWLLKVAFNLLNCLTQENLAKILLVFKHFIFKSSHYFPNDATPEEFDRWMCIYNGVVMSKLNNGFEQLKAAVAENWNQILLNEVWPYSLLLILLYRAEVDADQTRIVETELTEREIIQTTLKFTLLLEKNNVQLITKNQQLMYLMLVYFGKDRDFLEPTIKHLISQKLKAMKGFAFPPRLNVKLNKEKSFESLYTMFLDTFQSNSYGDNLFSVLVMIPLSQHFDVKWKKLVWSEYVLTMKFIGCQETDLLEDISEYLSPRETDVSLLKSYAVALVSNLLRRDSIPWKIAKHHVQHAKDSHSK